jgi:hypothetical protein
MPNGLWLGECFGDVASVAVGTVFGAGDYQRLGRQQMTESGFFRPFVTPEWCAPAVGCYSIILNNDNGASRDEGAFVTRLLVFPICSASIARMLTHLRLSGDVIFYAGSGGRRRGQNRSAPQSFDQVSAIFPKH